MPRGTLRDLLPGTASLPEDQQEKVYQGTAAVTYDTDRRVGCSWKSDSPDASHQLAIDVERVVSYDPAVSDDERAQEVYGEKETGTKLPAAGDRHSQRHRQPQPRRDRQHGHGRQGRRHGFRVRGGFAPGDEGFEPGHHTANRYFRDAGRPRRHPRKHTDRHRRKHRNPIREPVREPVRKSLRAPFRDPFRDPRRP